jgi:hypothetical protein
MTHVDPGLMNCGPHPSSSAVHPVYSPVDQFYDFSFTKIIPLIIEIPRPPYFYIYPIKLFHNYISVPVILHLGP